MTISRFELIHAEDLSLQYVSASEPDTIGIEVYHHGNMLFSVDMYEDGKSTIMFDDAENAEFEVSAFCGLIDRCVGELQEWRKRISGPGDIWDTSKPAKRT
jgi:hypothetical protein